jgi:hypothetical protein
MGVQGDGGMPSGGQGSESGLTREGAED